MYFCISSDLFDIGHKTKRRGKGFYNSILNWKIVSLSKKSLLLKNIYVPVKRLLMMLLMQKRKMLNVPETKVNQQSC